MPSRCAIQEGPPPLGQSSLLSSPQLSCHPVSGKFRAPPSSTPQDLCVDEVRLRRACAVFRRDVCPQPTDTRPPSHLQGQQPWLGSPPPSVRSVDTGWHPSSDPFLRWRFPSIPALSLPGHIAGRLSRFAHMGAPHFQPGPFASAPSLSCVSRQWLQLISKITAPKSASVALTLFPNSNKGHSSVLSGAWQVVCAATSGGAGGR